MKKSALLAIAAIIQCSAILFIPASSATTLDKTYTNSIGMKFIRISAGSFYMGTCQVSAANKKANKKAQFMGLVPQEATCPSGASAGADDRAPSEETPQHKVHINKAFQLGTYEVTVGQFKQFIASGGYDDLINDGFIKANSHGDSAAVSSVSWSDAVKFISWLNKKEGTKAYRLPTEAEWEYAARAGTTTKYSWGNSTSQMGNYAWYNDRSFDPLDHYTYAVGGKKPNPWGLYDMHGNVWEWVQDWYDHDYYRDSPTNDPKGVRSGRFRVFRGGSWYGSRHGTTTIFLRSAHRGSGKPGGSSNDLGFRLVRQP